MKVLSLKFPKGKNDLTYEASLPADTLREAKNVDIDKMGVVKRRDGYTNRLALTKSHSIFADNYYLYCVSTLGLIRVDPNDWSYLVLDSDFDPDRKVSYTNYPQGIAFTNGLQTGRIVNSQLVELSVPVPLKLPKIDIVANGVLQKGRYQVTITYVNSQGQESGARLSTTVELEEDNKAIQLSDFPDSPYSINIYVTPRNDSTFYRHLTVPSGFGTYLITRTIQMQSLNSQFHAALIPGEKIAYYNGRLYVANGNYVYYSMQQNYGNYDPSYNFIQFKEEVSIIAPVDNGIFVGAGITFFLSGDGPDSFKQKEAHKAFPIKGTEISVDASLFDIQEVYGTLAYWFSDRGGVLGLNSGIVIPVMEDAVEVSRYSYGSTMLREDNGIKKLVTSLTNKGESNKFGALDVATIEVIRNGIPVPA